MLPQLPFGSEIFDVVVSSHVIGHVPVEHKDTLVKEIARTLRPAGISAHIIETDSYHPVVNGAKRHAATYRKQFIEQDGHVGLELVSQNMERFERHGFRPISLSLVDAIIPSLQNFRKYLEHPDFADLPGITKLRWLNRWTGSNRLANAAYEVGMGMFHRTIEQWLGDPKRAQFILVSMVKTVIG
jgi:SAM-dependent methyltransferase